MGLHAILTNRAAKHQTIELGKINLGLAKKRGHHEVTTDLK